MFIITTVLPSIKINNNTSYDSPGFTIPPALHSLLLWLLLMPRPALL